MYRLLFGFFLIASVLLSVQTDSNLNFNSYDNLEDNHIEFYQNVNRKVQSLTTTPKPTNRFSIFHKRTRPLYRKNNKFQTSLTNYRIINDQPNRSNQAQLLKLNKTKSSNEFVDIYESNKRIDSRLDSPTNDLAETFEPSIAQQTVLAWEHGLKIKQQAKCEKPKPTVVYLNQDKEEVKIYLPRATILHRCGQNTGCCESESEQCVAIEQKQVNLYFFVIKLEKEFGEFDSNLDDQTSLRKGRKFSILDQNLNDDKQIKEYEYNLDYIIGDNELKLNDNYDLDLINKLKKEKNYLNSLLNQDDRLKHRLARSIRKGKDFRIEGKYGFLIIKSIY